MFRGARWGRKTNILRVNMWCVSLHSLSNRRVTSAIPFPWHWNVYRVRLKRRGINSKNEALLFTQRTNRVIHKNLLWLSFVKERWSMLVHRHICRFSLVQFSVSCIQAKDCTPRTVSRKTDISTRKTTSYICMNDQFLQLPFPIQPPTNNCARDALDVICQSKYWQTIWCTRETAEH